MKKILSCLLILSFIFFSGLNTIQVSAEELTTNQQDEKESTPLDEDSIPEQQDETKVSNTDENTETESIPQEEFEDNKIEIDVVTDSTSQSDLSQPLEPNNPADDLDQSVENPNEERTSIENKSIDLKWNPDKPGSFSFNKNNAEGTEIIVYLYKDDVRQFGQTSGSFIFENTCESDFSEDIEESGDYTFRVHVVSTHEDFFEDDKGIISDYSDVFHYIKPEQKIDAPIVSWDETKPGRVIWSNVQHAQTYEINISNDGFNTAWVANGEFITNESDFSSVMEPNSMYELRARAYSDNINLYTHSDYSRPVKYFFVGISDNINSNENDIQTTTVNNSSSNNPDESSVEFWIPTTEEEKIRYECMGKEKIQYITLNNQPFNINIQNAMQGEKCFDVFKNVADDYTIARTYNIFPLIETQKYSTDEKVTISLTIPETLRSESREFKMICVSQYGVPFIFEDQDKDADTITISTDKFYAYALIYKDLK